jgi:hypothetical protein
MADRCGRGDWRLRIQTERGKLKREQIKEVNHNSIETTINRGHRAWRGEGGEEVGGAAVSLKILGI